MTNDNKEAKKEERLEKQESRQLTEEDLEQVTGGVALNTRLTIAGGPMRSLQGQVPGVQISSDGQPSGSSSISVRGKASLNGSAGPLYVID